MDLFLFVPILIGVPLGVFVLVMVMKEFIMQPLGECISSIIANIKIVILKSKRDGR